MANHPNRYTTSNTSKSRIYGIESTKTNTTLQRRVPPKTLLSSSISICTTTTKGLVKCSSQFHHHRAHQGSSPKLPRRRAVGVIDLQVTGLSTACAQTMLRQCQSLPLPVFLDGGIDPLHSKHRGSFTIVASSCRNTVRSVHLSTAGVLGV